MPDIPKFMNENWGKHKASEEGSRGAITEACLKSTGMDAVVGVEMWVKGNEKRVFTVWLESCDSQQTGEWSGLDGMGITDHPLLADPQAGKHSYVGAFMEVTIGGGYNETVQESGQLGRSLFIPEA